MVLRDFIKFQEQNSRLRKLHTLHLTKIWKYVQNYILTLKYRFIWKNFQIGSMTITDAITVKNYKFTRSKKKHYIIYWVEVIT